MWAHNGRKGLATRGKMEGNGGQGRPSGCINKTQEDPETGQHDLRLFASVLLDGRCEVAWDKRFSCVWWLAPYRKPRAISDRLGRVRWLETGRCSKPYIAAL
ncbi:hypothetical protein LIA77_00446 [Sarocladium implicatum]|nr:hypothetical protein LIA77_00446 [Sarocladium implicatum]